jgi:hypothetical protein
MSAPIAAAIALLTALALGAAPIDFQMQIRPILARKCFACHGPDENARQAGLRLDSREAATGGTGGIVAIIPGNANKSRVIARVIDPRRPMPPTGERLSPEEIEILKQWIEQGAEYQPHWAFRKPVRHELPPVGDTSWPRNPIDYFVLARLEREGLRPSPQADPYTLARRVALDLTGLPPDPDSLAAYLTHPDDEAYEALVDRLFASPHYGERWARVWLDLARYADTQGYEKDNHRTIWPYRDWVVRAFNDNLPFDRFTILQLAGDLLPSPGADDLIATGFHRNTMTNTEGGTDDEEFRDAAVKDRVAVTGQVWMGLTWGCAQCHNHKYDPITHREFYQLYAFFNQTEDEDKPDDRPVLKLDKDVSTLILRELPPDKRRVTRVHERGNFLNPGAEVEPATPAAFHPFPEDAPRNRLGLAQWLVHPDNPLTARVQVNRLWSRLFGRGLVESEEDFGTQGLAPSHPELLDWLATEFIRLNWNMKALLKTIVLSAAYRQSSNVPPELYERDPYNRLLARGPRFRLDAEMIRDQALAASGLLSRKLGGPPVMPWQPDGIWLVVYNGEKWETSKGEDRYRRSLYTFHRRTAPYPSMITYDAPTGEVCTIRRVRTNTPLQALTTLNDPVMMEAAQHLALRILREARNSNQDRAERLFRAVLLRPPSGPELKRILALHRDAAKDLSRRPDDARMLLRYGETLYKEDRQVTLIADARTEPPVWHYQTRNPGEGWQQPAYDDSAWSLGRGQFGHQKSHDPENPVNTCWDTEQIWLRIPFELPSDRLENFRLRVRSQGSFAAWINGVPAASSTITRGGYYEYAVHPDAVAALKPNGNILALHSIHHGEPGSSQSIDASLTAARAPDLGPGSKDDASRAAWVVVANTVLNLDETLTRR